MTTPLTSVAPARRQTGACCWLWICLLAICPAVASAQSYPSKPIRVLVPLSAGSAVDVIPRIVYDEVGKHIGQPFVFENRVGAGGSIAANVVAKSDPDGYTIFAGSSLVSTLPVFFKKLPLDVTADLAGVSVFGYQPNLLVIAKAQAINSIPEFVAAAKGRPNGITFGSTGGSPNLLNGEHFKITMGLNARAVMFRGAPEVLTEVLTSRVDIYFSPLALALPFVRDGQMKALAVSSRKRSSALPDVPTSFEQGYPDSEFGLWFAAWAPTATPRDIVMKLYTETTRALDNPEVKAKLAKLAVEPMPLKPEEIDKKVKTEVASFTKLATTVGIIAE